MRPLRDIFAEDINEEEGGQASAEDKRGDQHVYIHDISILELLLFAV